MVKIWWFGEWLCRGATWLYYMSLMVSSFTMTAMAMEK